MNIFVLDTNTELCAKYHCDKHVVKMITEHAQMLSTACRSCGIDAGYKSTHLNHPCNIWLRESMENWLWLEDLTFELHDEWRYRYGHPKSKSHKAFEVMRTLPIPDLPSIPRTPFALAMPDQYKSDDAVKSYRNYYMGEKQHIATWKNRDIPEWFNIQKIDVDKVG